MTTSSFGKFGKKFGKDVHCMRGTKTPGTPIFGIACPINENNKISSGKQKLHPSGVGMLLYLVSHSCPDIANADRELFKVLDGANMAIYKEMHQAIKHVLDTRDLGLQNKPIQESEQSWELIFFSDSDYAINPASRKSPSGFVFYI